MKTNKCNIILPKNNYQIQPYFGAPKNGKSLK